MLISVQIFMNTPHSCKLSIHFCIKKLNISSRTLSTRVACWEFMENAVFLSNISMMCFKAAVSIA